MASDDVLSPPETGAETGAGADARQRAIDALAEALHETPWLCNHGPHLNGERPQADDHDAIDASQLLAYLTAHPEAEAAVAAWLSSAAGRGGPRVVLDELIAQVTTDLEYLAEEDGQGLTDRDRELIAAAVVTTRDRLATPPAPDLRAALERAQGELEGAHRWVALIVLAAGGTVIVPNAWLARDTPTLMKSYDPVTFTTKFLAAQAETGEAE